ncbi:hypothetical protein GH733_005732, partial [Mirounga leonina]
RRGALRLPPPRPPPPLGPGSPGSQARFSVPVTAFRAATLIQRWYRRYAARLEMRRHCTWRIFQSIEYAGQQDQVKVRRDGGWSHPELCLPAQGQHGPSARNGRGGSGPLLVLLALISKAESLVLLQLHDFFSYLVDHFTPSSNHERDFLNRMFTEKTFPQDAEMEKLSDYESIAVPDSYTGPRLSFPLLPDHATALVEAFRLKQQLHARYVLNLLHEARKHLVQLPNINRVSTCYSEEVTVCGKSRSEMAPRARCKQESSWDGEIRGRLAGGDLHGQLDDLIFIFYKLNIIFQIHGKKILKILQDVFCWLPLATLVDEKVLILHGGVSDMTDLELLAKLDRHKIVSTLRRKTRKENGKPATTQEKATPPSCAGRPTPWFLPQSRSLPASPLRLGACGAPRAGRSSSIPCSGPADAEELARRARRSGDLELDRGRQQAGFPGSRAQGEPLLVTPEADSDADEPPEPTPEEWKQVVDILWSDPMAQEGCKANTVRGGGCYFGPNVTEQLLQKYNLQFLIRSHECKPEGYEFCHSRKVLTIFSASNYYEVGSNRGAYVKLGPALTPYIVQYQANKATHMLTMRQRQDFLMNDFQKNRIMVFDTGLISDKPTNHLVAVGFISLSDWAEAVESVLRLGLPWRMLRPQLVSSSMDNTLEYKSWLEGLAKEQLSHENIQSSLLETLYRNRSNLETIFRIIDSDHSGFISLDEFRQTWKLFSSHMNIDITDDCICDLARSIDFNKDGHIDINEFLEAFRLVEQSCTEGDASDCPQATNTNDSGCSKPSTP